MWQSLILLTISLLGFHKVIVVNENKIIWHWNNGRVRTISVNWNKNITLEFLNVKIKNQVLKDNVLYIYKAHKNLKLQRKHK